MTRKNLFTPPSGPPPTSGPTPGPGGSAGAATQMRSGAANPLMLMREDLQRIVRDIDTDLIVSSPFSDRLFESDPDMPALQESITAHGQMVPALLRPLPSDGGPRRFEIVYGRRRLAAARALGRPLRAIVQDLGDLEALHAMGIENNRRRDTSFIEKAFFARRLRIDSGLTLSQVGEILSVHESHVSRMVGIAETLGEDIVRKLGFCEGVGRRPWEDLARHLELARRRHPNLVLPDMSDIPMDDRLEHLAGWLVKLIDAGTPGTPTQLGDGLLELSENGGSTDAAEPGEPGSIPEEGHARDVADAAPDTGRQVTGTQRPLKLPFGRERESLVHYSRNKRGLVLRFLVSQDTDGFDGWFDRNVETVLEEIRSMWLAAQAADRDDETTSQTRKGGAMTSP